MTTQWHTMTLTTNHPNHDGEKCYCKNCACMYWSQETSRDRGSVYCKVCEELDGEPFEAWLHKECPDGGCAEHCTKRLDIGEPICL